MLNKKEEEINKMATMIMNISNDKKRILSYILSVGVIWLVILCLLTVTLQGKKYVYRYLLILNNQTTNQSFNDILKNDLA